MSKYTQFNFQLQHFSQYKPNKNKLKDTKKNYYLLIQLLNKIIKYLVCDQCF